MSVIRVPAFTADKVPLAGRARHYRQVGAVQHTKIVTGYHSRQTSMTSRTQLVIYLLVAQGKPSLPHVAVCA